MTINHENKKLVTLTFHRKELIYDISNCAYVQGDVIDAVGEHVMHQVTDIGEDGNIDCVTRTLNLAYQESMYMLYPYTKVDIVQESSLDNTFVEPEMYIMKLSVPKDFSEGTVELLKNLIHEYMKCRVLEDWLSITYPNAQPYWRDKAEYAKEKIMESINARGKRVRRTLTPF